MSDILRDLLQSVHLAAGHKGPVEWCNQTECIKRREALSALEDVECDYCGRDGRDAP